MATGASVSPIFDSGERITSHMASRVGGAPGATRLMSNVTFSAAPGPNMQPPSRAMPVYSTTAVPKASASRPPHRCGCAMEL
jgi:hypothetical protein